VLEPARRHLQHRFQHCGRRCTPGRQNTCFMLIQLAVAMCSRVPHQDSAELHQ
jgi:hypothetical protein